MQSDGNGQRKNNPGHLILPVGHQTYRVSIDITGSQANEWACEPRIAIHLMSVPITVSPSYEVLNRALGEFDYDRMKPTVVGDSAIAISSENLTPDFKFTNTCDLMDAHFGPPS